MPRDRRGKHLDRNVKQSDTDLKKTVRRSQNAVNGVVSDVVNDPRFMTNVGLRNQLYTTLAGEYAAFNDDIANWSLDQGMKTAKDFYEYAKEDLPNGAGSATFGAFSAKYVEDIIAKVNPATIPKQVAINASIGGMKQEHIRALRAAVSTTMAEGAVEGLTNAEMAQRMASKLGNVKGFQFIDKGGRTWTADNYFGMLNRSLHATVARETYISEAVNEAGYDLFIVAGGVTGSSVDNPDDPCDRWAGRIISMTGNTPGYPTYSEAQAEGVFHAQCVHFLRVALPSEIGTARKTGDVEGLATGIGAR